MTARRVEPLHHRRSAPCPPPLRSYERKAHQLAPGVVDYDGLLLDGWMIVDDGSSH
jgi:hypothetical protein